MVVDSPSPEVGAIHVAVGVNVVWAITKDHKVRHTKKTHKINTISSIILLLYMVCLSEKFKTFQIWSW